VTETEVKELRKLFKEFYPSEWMNKKQTITYLNVANNTFDKKFIDLPFHDIHGTIRWNKSEIDAFMKQH